MLHWSFKPPVRFNLPIYKEELEAVWTPFPPFREHFLD